MKYAVAIGMFLICFYGRVEADDLHMELHEFQKYFKVCLDDTTAKMAAYFYPRENQIVMSHSPHIISMAKMKCMDLMGAWAPPMPSYREVK